MPGFISQFETPTPVKFREKGCDTEFEAIVMGGLYIDDYDESVFGTDRNDAIDGIKQIAVDKIKDCLEHWHEGDRVLYFEGKDVLGLAVLMAIKEKGIMGSSRINVLKLTDETYDAYQELIVKPIKEREAEEKRRQIEEADEPHGPLREFGYNLSSHGMMAGTGSGSSRTIKWNDDGTIIYSYSAYGGGTNIIREYRISPEIASKAAELVNSKKLAAIAKLDIELPAAADNFTGSTISMTFDDSSLGGESNNHFCLNCGVSGMVFGRIEEEVSSLFDEIEKSGECIKAETTENSFGFSGFAGMFNMTHKAPSQDNAVKNADARPKWICNCGTENKGKFCSECGTAKPEGGWVCDCGLLNFSRFCPNCGKANVGSL